MARHRDEFPRGVSLQDLEDIASSFAEGKVAPAEFTEALALTDADWIAVRLAFRRVRKTYYKLWLPDALRGQYSIPTDLLGYLNRGFQLDPAWQVCVAGLSSLDSQHMALAANAALHRLWQLSVGAWKQANDPTKPPNPDVGEQLQKELDPEDQFTETESVEQASVSQEPMAVHSVRRVPTLVVIDEAHNFAPAQPANELQARVSDKIALIAAEESTTSSCCWQHNARRNCDLVYFKNVRMLASFGSSRAQREQVPLKRLEFQRKPLIRLATSSKARHCFSGGGLQDIAIVSLDLPAQRWVVLGSPRRIGYPNCALTNKD